MAWAISSLPVPVSPLIRMECGVAAYWRAVRITSAMTWLWKTNLSKPAGVADLFLKVPAIVLGLDVSEGALQRDEEYFRVDRFLQEIVGALFHRQHRGLDGSGPGQHHEAVGVLPGETFQQVQPVAIGQGQVEQHQVESGLPQLAQWRRPGNRWPRPGNRSG